MLYLVYVVHIVVCLFLILVVLLQQGKGADLSVFGGGSTQTAFGARGAATLLHKMTVGAFVAFIFTTIGIGFLQRGGGGSSVMSTVEEAPAPETATPAAIPAEPTPEPLGEASDEIAAPAEPTPEASSEPGPPPADQGTDEPEPQPPA